MGNQNKNYKTRKETRTSINNSTKWSALSCYSSCQRSSSAVCTGSGAGCSERNNNPKLRIRSQLQKTLTLMQARKKAAKGFCPYHFVMWLLGCKIPEKKQLEQPQEQNEVDKAKAQWIQIINCS